MEWSTVTACPSLMCFFNRGCTEGTNFLKILCLTFVYVLLFVSGLILWVLGICGLMTCVKSMRQFEVCFSPDVILCG